eukprot:Skav210473  [mRNA]  locus=scaffold737:493475:503581:- [translate_table: standard]
MYSRTSGLLTEAEWQRIGFCRLKVRDIREWNGDTQTLGALGALKLVELVTPLWCTMSHMAHLPSSVEPGWLWKPLKALTGSIPSLVICAILCSLAKSQDTAPWYSTGRGGKPMLHIQVLERGVPNCKPVKFKLRCYINMARNLQCDGDRVPSSFCEVACAGQRQSTAVVPQTSSPYWADMLDMNIRLQCSLQNMRCYSEPIQLTVYDVMGKGLLERVADLTNNATQLPGGRAQGRSGELGPPLEDQDRGSTRSSAKQLDG